MHHLTEPKLEELFRQVLQLAPSSDVTHLSQGEVPEWDSEAQESLLLAIENEFGIPIDACDAIELTSFDAVASFLEGNGS